MATRTLASQRVSLRLRFADRYVGIPVVRTIGLLKRRRPMPPDFRSLGLLQTAAIGDTILLAGVISDLKRLLPGKRIVLFVGPSNYEIARLLQGVDEVARLPVSRPFRAIRMLRRAQVDVLCDFGSWPRINALLACFSGAAFTLGFRTSEQYRHYTYDEAVEHSREVHEIENYRRLVSALGVDSKSPPRINLEPGVFNPLNVGTYVVFHAWPGGYKRSAKEWPDHHWVELAQRVSGLGLSIVLTGGEDDREKAERLCKRIGSAVSARVVNLAGTISLVQTARVLQDAAAVVSVNTGIMHLAAAVGALVVALNGPVPGRRWGPVGDRAISVDASADGCGYLNLGFEYKNQREDCMATILPGPVFEVVRARLASSLSTT